jgi:hypothetical protein
MAATRTPDDEPSRHQPTDRFQDDLVGLDPDDPEARAFAEHLDRVEKVRSGYTVEGYLADMSDFADGANRLGGHYRLMATLLALVILLGVGVAAWDSLTYLLSTIFN